VVNNLPLAPAGVFRDDLETFDLDFQHGFALGARNRLVWGLVHRRTYDEVTNSPGLAFLPADLQQDLSSIFVQDEIALVPDQLKLTLGTKFEHNDYTGWESAPNARLQWQFTDDQMLWTSVSRAVRMPSRIDRDYSQPAPNVPPLNFVLVTGGADFQSETVLAWEAGYRAQIGDSMITSVSVFYNDYDDIRSTNITPVIFPLFFDNDLEATTHGVELNASYQVRDWWRLSGGYNLLQQDVRVKSGRYDFNNALNETADPQHQVSLRSSMELPGNVELDLNLRWVDELVKNDGGVADNVPGYTELNLRLGWTPVDNVELSVVGQNLLDTRHPEFGITAPEREEIERSIYAKVAWRY
jgi:iron complex outermembrane receptor protein